MFSGGFRSAVVGDKSFQFTKKQAAVMEALYEARWAACIASIGTRLRRRPTAIGGSSSFRDNKEASDAFIGSDNQGYYWLKL